MAWSIHNILGAVFGRDARKETGKILREYGCRRVALIYDSAMLPLGFERELLDIIKAEQIEVLPYQAASGEPSSSELEKFVHFCREAAADGLVALGGGSVMDTAKLTGKILANGGNTIDYLGGYTSLDVGNKLFRPIIALPTTAGTGSESCWGIMCLNEETGIKTYTRHPPTRAVVDPVYSMGLPAYITAYTGMDALAQAAECLVNSSAMPNWMADTLCREALDCAVRYLPIAVHEPDNAEAREKMCWSAMLSGYAITLRKTSSGHAIANQISDAYNEPHGVGVGCGLAALARYNIHGDAQTSRIWAPYFQVECPAGADMLEVGQRVSDKIDAFQKNIGMKSMKELGIAKSFCDTAADNISRDKKWEIVPKVPDFELLRKCINESWDY